jgi:carbohydrate kinase (thermoresistant glucokinase family)
MILVRIALSIQFNLILKRLKISISLTRQQAPLRLFFINSDSAVQLKSTKALFTEMHVTEQPLRIIVMGVSGSGKSTLAQGLREALGIRMKDGDELHLPQSIAKMSAGIALQDEDRWPWLEKIANYLNNIEGSEQGSAGSIVACSALKKIYRDRIRQQAGPVVFLFLDGNPDLIRQRMMARQDHYMNAALLDSQMQTLEKPNSQENDVVHLSIDQTASQILHQALEQLQALRKVSQRPSLSLQSN